MDVPARTVRWHSGFGGAESFTFRRYAAKPPAIARRAKPDRFLGVPTIGQLEEQVYVVEGFRIRLTPFDGKRKSFPSYDFRVMAPQRWRLSEWKTIRLAAYLMLLRDATPLRGDGTPVKRDMQLGHLRDSYYEAQYGDVAASAKAADNIVDIKRERKLDADQER